MLSRASQRKRRRSSRGSGWLPLLALGAVGAGACSQTHIVLILVDAGAGGDGGVDAAVGDARSERGDAGAVLPVAAAVVSAGASHACGIVAGALYCWGTNDQGQLGLGDRNLRAAPGRVGTGADWSAVAASLANTIALRSDGSLWAWGANDVGQLGTGTASGPNGGAAQNTPLRVGVRNDWIRIASHASHACAIASDGSLWCWGQNAEGQMGHNDGYAGDGVANYFAAPTLVPKPGPAPDGGTADRSWISVDTGQGHTCAVLAPGTLWCWGRNTSAQLGQGSTDMQQIRHPVQIGTGSTWQDVTCGQQFSCAFAGGVLACWGESDGLQIPGAPVGSRTVSTPLRILLPGVVVTASVNFFVGLAITRAGAAIGWGRNVEGQLGLGDTMDRTSPTVIIGDGCTQVSAGQFFACGVRLGAIYCTGENNNGQLGLGDTNRRSTPESLSFP